MLIQREAGQPAEWEAAELLLPLKTWKRRSKLHKMGWAVGVLLLDPRDGDI